jgi:hypothetical protein
MRSGETAVETPKRLITHFMVCATSRLRPFTISGLSAGLSGMPFCQNHMLFGAACPIEIFSGYAAQNHWFHPVGQDA